jgi:hypothetical protein
VLPYVRRSEIILLFQNLYAPAATPGLGNDDPRVGDRLPQIISRVRHRILVEHTLRLLKGLRNLSTRMREIVEVFREACAPPFEQVKMWWHNRYWLTT